LAIKYLLLDIMTIVRSNTPCRIKLTGTRGGN